jgi:hypothetical protein
MSATIASPVPAWKRYATMALIAVLAIVAAYVLYTKELHHSASSSTGTTPPATAPAPVSPTPTHTTAPTTIPGGLPISSRNPFQ